MILDGNFEDFRTMLTQAQKEASSKAPLSTGVPFGSLSVDSTSSTPYSVATQVSRNFLSRTIISFKSPEEKILTHTIMHKRFYIYLDEI